MANFTRNSYILNLLKLRKESSQPVEHNFSVIFFYGGVTLATSGVSHLFYKIPYSSTVIKATTRTSMW